MSDQSNRLQLPGIRQHLATLCARLDDAASNAPDDVLRDEVRVLASFAAQILRDVHLAEHLAADRAEAQRALAELGERHRAGKARLDELSRRVAALRPNAPGHDDLPDTGSDIGNALRDAWMHLG